MPGAKVEQYHNYTIETAPTGYDVYYAGRFIIGDFKSAADAKKWIRENGNSTR